MKRSAATWTPEERTKYERELEEFRTKPTNVAANKICDEINKRCLEFGGRHEDIVTVLELGVELGILKF